MSKGIANVGTNGSPDSFFLGSGGQHSLWKSKRASFRPAAEAFPPLSVAQQHRGCTQEVTSLRDCSWQWLRSGTINNWIPNQLWKPHGRAGESVAGLKLPFSQAIPAERRVIPLGNNTKFCTTFIGYLQTDLSPANGPAPDEDLAIWLTLSRWLIPLASLRRLGANLPAVNPVDSVSRIQMCCFVGEGCTMTL